MEALYVTGGGQRAAAGGAHAARGVRTARAAQHVHALGHRDRPRDPGGRVVGLHAARRVLAELRRVAGARRRAPVMVFDVIFPCGTPLPGPGEPPLTVRRAYRPSTTSATSGISRRAAWTAAASRRATSPCGTRSCSRWTPRSSSARAPRPRAGRGIRHGVGPAHRGAVRVQCGAGSLAVTIHNLTSHHVRQYPLGRWSSKASPLRSGPEARAAVTRGSPGAPVHFTPWKLSSCRCSSRYIASSCRWTSVLYFA